MDDTVVAQFTSALPRPGAVVTDTAAMTESGHDYWGFGGTPGLLLRPRSREEVAAVIRIAGGHRIPWSHEAAPRTAAPG